MTDWLDVCRACVADVRAVLCDLPTRVEREAVVGAGRGGDETTAVDRAAEAATLARLRAVEEPLTIVSEDPVALFDDERPFDAAELDLEGRSRVVAAGNAELCRQLAHALSA